MANITLTNSFKRDSISTLLKIFVPGVAFIGLMAIYAFVFDIRFTSLSRDPIQTLEAKPYIGIMSNVGIIFWCATAAILFFSYKLARLQHKPIYQARFFLYSGFLTVLMLIDDLFLLHDVIFLHYLQISEKLFYYFYAGSVIALVISFRKIILNSDYILLILTFGFLASSAFTDFLLEFGVYIPYPYLVEDGFKFLGIISWFAYFIRTSYKYISIHQPAISKN